ncbi:hypothetical protein ACFXHK_46815, partial [Embleya sp. NPDC059267]|uniref:hypothetical protein n=1 Tax=Embleya sp. NPDC059267 TaxID=3346798 RepID=UPI003692EDAE
MTTGRGRRAWGTRHVRRSPGICGERVSISTVVARSEPRRAAGSAALVRRAGRSTIGDPEAARGTK